jgi:hypothetical protein
VKLLSSLLEVPAQLALALSLAAATVGNEGPAAPDAAGAPAHVTLQPQSLEGPFRFGEGIWFRALKEALPGKDAPAFSARIFKTSGGRYYVPAAAERRQILEARKDGVLAGRVARAFAERNARGMRAALQRQVTAGDLYIAHVFGPEAALSFIKLAHARPNEAAAKHMPELARAAPALLAPKGVPISLAGLYERLTKPLNEGPHRSPAAKRAPNDPSGRAVRTLKPTVEGVPERVAVVPEGRAWRPKINATAQASAPQ